MRAIQFICLLCVIFFCASCSTGQEKEPAIKHPATTDVSNAAIDDTNASQQGVKWKVEAKKLEGSGNYELGFTAPASNQWQIFSPKQDLSGSKAAELVFADSSITPGDYTIQSELTKVNNPIFSEVEIFAENKPLAWKALISIKGTVPAKLSGTLRYSFGKEMEFLQGEFPFEVAIEGGVEPVISSKIASIDINNPVIACGDEGTSQKSIAGIFFLGFLGGLIALLTPCVFPMVPVTVTFFTKKSNDKSKAITNAVLYGLFIFLIYILITVPFHIANETLSPAIFNNISTSVWLNLAFFVVFLVFALSFFGLFEITLPAAIANRADSKSGINHIGGIFFMAATLAIVSFSCTGPILGTLLVGVADQGAWPLTAGAAGFGLALGLPFALFAMFPNWLKTLPRSGGWMSEVKIVLAFVELALAIKFLSNADLVEQWGILKREPFILSWVIIGTLITAYLIYKLVKARTRTTASWIIRPALIVLFGGFTIYLLPGIFNTESSRLPLISGFPPPACYSWYDNPVNCKRGFKPLENDYQAAIEKARKENKPLLLDFTGWACVNCRKMEENVWTSPVVDSLMRNEFVVASFYVDERRKLPLTEQTTVTLSNGVKQKLVTVGQKWTVFQTENFHATSQPQYAIISPNQIALTKTKYYTPQASEFAEWLECGLEAFRKDSLNRSTASESSLPGEQAAD